MRFEKAGEMKCANLDAFVNIVNDYEKTENVTSLYLVLKYLDTLKKKESGGDSPKMLGENENVVRIMTMHKSKGLEFPVVFIANTTSKYNELDLNDKLLTSSTLGIGIDILDKSTGVIYPSIIKQVIKQNTSNRLRSEALRLLYVAFTRAMEVLHLSSNRGINYVVHASNTPSRFIKEVEGYYKDCNIVMSVLNERKPSYGGYSNNYYNQN